MAVVRTERNQNHDRSPGQFIQIVYPARGRRRIFANFVVSLRKFPLLVPPPSSPVDFVLSSRPEKTAEQETADQETADQETGPSRSGVGDWQQSRDQLAQQIARLQRQMRLTIESQLQAFAGRTHGCARRNGQWVREIHQMLERHGLRVACPECGHASILRLSPRRGSPGGVFVFDHTIDGRRTFHGGGGKLPVIRLISKPPRRRHSPPNSPPNSTPTSGD